jgi:UDP-N-acetylmuramoylalanine-D-glutamate ligase
LDPSEGIKDLTCLIGEVKQKVHTLIIVGEDIANVKKTFVGLTNLIQAANLEEAVKTAYFFANEPDVVIYSPASGSEEQVDINGKRFLRLVNDL